MNFETVAKNISKPNFPENEDFLPRDTYTHVCVSGVKNCSFLRKLGLLYCPVTTVLRLSLPYY